MNLQNVAEKIWKESKAQGIEYNPTHLPIKITADCYIFYATPMNEDCTKHGNCKVLQYYALTGGECVRILK